MTPEVEAAREICKKISEMPQTATLADFVEKHKLDPDKVIGARFRNLSGGMRTALREGRLPLKNAYALSICPNRNFEARALTELPEVFVPALFAAGKS